MDIKSTQRLKKFRLEKGLSQEKLASSLGITRSSYTQIELGNSGIQDEHLPKLVELGLNLNWLFNEHGEMEIAEKTQAYQQLISKKADCEKELEYLKKTLDDKEQIIALLKSKTS